jgi:hypothetical protein
MVHQLRHGITIDDAALFFRKAICRMRPNRKNKLTHIKEAALEKRSTEGYDTVDWYYSTKSL